MNVPKLVGPFKTNVAPAVESTTHSALVDVVPFIDVISRTTYRLRINS